MDFIYILLFMALLLFVFYYINKKALKKRWLSFWFLWTLVNSSSMLDRLAYWFNIIEGMFWTWKSIFMTYLALLASKDENCIVFSNIKLNIDSNRIFYFDDNDLDSILDVCYIISKEQNNSDLVKRSNRLKFYVFLDEWAVIFNSTSLKEYKWKYKDSNIDNLLYQLRKVNVYTLIWVQRPNRLLKMIRENVDQVFYFKPLIWENESLIWRFVWKFIGQYRLKLLDWDLPWNPTLNLWTPEEPRYYDVKVWWMWKPSIHKFYDDLYINTKYVKPVEMDKEYVEYIDYIKSNFVHYKNKDVVKKINQDDLDKQIKDMWFEKLT